MGLCKACGSNNVKKLRTVHWRGVKFYVYRCQNCCADMSSRMYERKETEDNPPLPDNGERKTIAPARTEADDHPDWPLPN